MSSKNYKVPYYKFLHNIFLSTFKLQYLTQHSVLKDPEFLMDVRSIYLRRTEFVNLQESGSVINDFEKNLLLKKQKF